jgi:hypothetical protein
MVKRADPVRHRTAVSIVIGTRKSASVLRSHDRSRSWKIRDPAAFDVSNPWTGGVRTIPGLGWMKFVGCGLAAFKGRVISRMLVERFGGAPLRLLGPGA